MNSKRIKNDVSLEVKKIESLLKNEIHEKLLNLMQFNIEKNNFLEFELTIYKKVIEIGRSILENTIPLIYGDGYKGSKVVIDSEESYSCVLRKNPRNLKTIFGNIKLTRAYYQYDQTGGSLGLLDKEIDIHNYKTSPALRYYAGLTGTITSFREASDVLKRLNGINLSSTEIDVLTESKAKEVQDKYAQKVKRIPHDCDGKITPAILDVDNNPERIIYLECDGCFVPTDEEWRECKTLILFEAEIKDDKTFIKNKKYYSTIKGIVPFKKQVRTILEEYCDKSKVKIICLGDGAKWIWRMVQELIPQGRLEILDWFHVSERVGEIALKVYPTNEDNRKELRDEINGYFYNSKYKKAISRLNEIYENTQCAELKELIYQNIGYFDRNKQRMDYKEYREKGYTIGSGAIESANKFVVQRRLKIPGSVWTVQNADAMAHLRAEYVNGNMDKLYGITTNPLLGVT
jgi:hypothetical protein